MNEEDLTRFRLCSSYQGNSEGNLRNIPIKAQIFLVNYWYRSGQDEVYASVSPLGICGGSARETRDNTPHSADLAYFSGWRTILHWNGRQPRELRQMEEKNRRTGQEKQHVVE